MSAWYTNNCGYNPVELRTYNILYVQNYDIFLIRLRVSLQSRRLGRSLAGIKPVGRKLSDRWSNQIPIVGLVCTEIEGKG